MTFSLWFCSAPVAGIGLRHPSRTAGSTHPVTSDTVSTVGGLLPKKLLDRVADIDPQLPGMDATDFGMAPGERLRDAVTRSWNRMSALWAHFRRAEQAGGCSVSSGGGSGVFHAGGAGPLSVAAGTTARMTRQSWLRPLFDELGFAGLSTVSSLTTGATIPGDTSSSTPVGTGTPTAGKSYAISHEWAGRVPVPLLGWRTPVDRRTPGLRGAAAASPHGLVQEFLNRSEPHLWGIVSTGRVANPEEKNTEEILKWAEEHVQRLTRNMMWENSDYGGYWKAPNRQDQAMSPALSISIVAEVLA